MICKNCGMELSDEAKFCSNCGTPVTKEEIEVPMEEFIRSREWPMGKVMNCLRLALAGTSSGLGIADIVSRIGRKEVARRISAIKSALQ